VFGGTLNPAQSNPLLLQEIQTGFGFTFLVPAHPGSPRQNPEIRETVVVVVVVYILFDSKHVILEMLLPATLMASTEELF